MADSPAANTEQPVPEERLHEDGLIGHLYDLRSCVLWALGVFAVAFVAMFPFADEIYTAFAGPLLSVLPEDAELIATGVIAPFLVPIKVVAFCAFCVTLPHTLYQAWRFVGPGLYRREKGFAVPLVVSATALFYTGMVFAYFLVFKVVFAFIVDFAPESIAVMPDVQSHLGFALLLFLTFGCAFEMPVAVFLLVRSGFADLDGLRKARPYVTVGSFAVAAIITPPDVISQFMLALPVLALYELGIQVSSLCPPPEDTEEPD